MDIVVDARDSWEQATGWYCYLENTLATPFKARCIALRQSSPLDVDDEVRVTGLPGEEECAAEMFVLIDWKGRALAVPLSQIEPVGRVSRATREAIADWHYWVQRGYEF